MKEKSFYLSGKNVQVCVCVIFHLLRHNACELPFILSQCTLFFVSKYRITCFDERLLFVLIMIINSILYEFSARESHIHCLRKKQCYLLNVNL